MAMVLIVSVTLNVSYGQTTDLSEFFIVEMIDVINSATTLKPTKFLAATMTK